LDRGDASRQDSVRGARLNDISTDVENPWPQASHDHWWRTWLVLTNSDASGANTRSLHRGQYGSAKPRDMA
jgi:hypothetical protein